MAAAKRKRPEDMQAYDLWALSYEAFLRGTEADLDQALAYQDAAIAKDPSFVRAYTKKAWTRLMLVKFRNDWADAVAEMSTWLGSRSASIPTTPKRTPSLASPTP